MSDLIKIDKLSKFCNDRIAELERDDMIHPSQKSFGIREAKRMLKFINAQANEVDKSTEKALHKHGVIASASGAKSLTICKNCKNYKPIANVKTVGICLLDDEKTWNSAKCAQFEHLLW